MNGNRVALDTNQAIAVLNGVAGVEAWLTRFAEILVPVPVVGELLYGALNSRRPVENTHNVEKLLSRCAVLSATLPTAEVYAQLRARLKTKGRPIPENDLWIAAICVEQQVPLATDDAHFGDVDELQILPPPGP